MFRSFSLYVYTISMVKSVLRCSLYIFHLSDFSSLHVWEEVEEEQPAEQDCQDDVSLAQVVAELEAGRQERLVPRSSRSHLASEFSHHFRLHVGPKIVWQVGSLIMCSSVTFPLVIELFASTELIIRRRWRFVSAKVVSCYVYEMPKQ